MNRENNIRQISQFLREIQQISEYSTNRNTFNININYYEKYYNGFDDQDLYSPDRQNNSTESPTNSYLIEVNRERDIPISNNVPPRSTETTHNNPVNNTETNVRENNTTQHTIRRQFTIPFRTTTNIGDPNGNLSQNITNSLGEITNLINRSLVDSLSNISLDNINIDIDSSARQSTSLTIADLNTKTSLVPYISLPEENREAKCHICNEDYTSTDICRKNNLCGHYLHQTCLDNWYSSHNTCPICNRIV